MYNSVTICLLYIVIVHLVPSSQTKKLMFPQYIKICLTWDTLVTTPHGCIQLKEAAKTFHSQVAHDLIRLKLAELLTSQRQGKFKLIDINIYVFQHSEYNECSRVKLSSFVACSAMEETLMMIKMK